MLRLYVCARFDVQTYLLSDPYAQLSSLRQNVPHATSDKSRTSRFVVCLSSSPLLSVMRCLRRPACYICLSLGDVFSSPRRQPFCLHRVCPRAQSHASRAQSAVWLPWDSVGRYLTLGHGGLHMGKMRCRGVYINFTYEILPGLPQSMSHANGEDAAADT